MVEYMDFRFLHLNHVGLHTVQMFLESSIMHELINKHAISFFSTIAKKLYQVSMMYS